MKYDKDKELRKLEKTNEELVKFMKDYPKNRMIISAIGNSISTGFSFSEPSRFLLDRNKGLIECGKNNNLDINTYHFSRSENNNSYNVFKWIIDNISERQIYEMNRFDYLKRIKRNKELLSKKEINKYFKNPSDMKIQDVIFDNDKQKSNIIVLNLGTGSFLDVVTRKGSLSIPSISTSLKRDISGIISILELIQNNNRDNNSNTQIYICGAPKILNTFITDLFINRKIKRLENIYSNITYVPSFPRQVFYKDRNNNIILDPHYSEAEYYLFLNEIENKIIDNYLVKDLLIDIDRALYKLSKYNELHDKKYSVKDIKDIIDEIAKKYESKTGDYNYFIDIVKNYVKVRYPHDFYYADEKRNASLELDDMKRGKK